MDNLNAFQVKREICEIGRRMYERNYVAANDGNISVRISDREILTTPTGVSKGFMTPEMIVCVDMDGKVISGSLKPSSELKMHLRVYRERPDVRSVVHAHPITATAFSVCGMGLDKAFMPELVVTLGVVPLADYATPGTTEVPDSITQYLKDYNAVLLAHHGALTWGKDLMEAYFRLESVEFSAQIVWKARMIGSPNQIPCEKLGELVKIRESMGIHGVVPTCDACGVSGSCAAGASNTARIGSASSVSAARSSTAQPSPAASELEDIVARVTERVVAALHKP